jgi:selenocysteine lyase/cysteine desulfurase
MHAGYYGSPLRLATTARRLDASPAWFAWMGAVTSLAALIDVGLDTVHDHDAGLADALRAELELEPTGSAIVSLTGEGLEETLSSVGIVAATRANGCRLSFHLYNDDEDVAAAAAALRQARWTANQSSIA